MGTIWRYDSYLSSTHVPQCTCSCHLIHLLEEKKTIADLTEESQLLKEERRRESAKVMDIEKDEKVSAYLKSLELPSSTHSR